jgi:hypothetical protein
MTALLASSGMALLVLPGLLMQRWNHLSPRDWARLNFASLGIGLWAVRAGLALSAAPTVLRAFGVEHAAVACHELFGSVLPGGAPIGWMSAAGLLALQLRVLQSRRQTRRALELMRVEAWVGTHTVVDGVDVVRLPTSEPVAYAIGGVSPQVVISDGLVDVLSDQELAAVVRHERSHIDHGHQRHLDLAAAADASVGWLRPVRRSIDALRLGVERWADEDAATRPAQRLQVRAALLKVTATMLMPAPSFTTGCTILDRMVALDQDPPCPTATTRAVAAAPLLGLTASTAVTLIAWSTYTPHGFLALAQYCPL